MKEICIYYDNIIIEKISKYCDFEDFTCEDIVLSFDLKILIIIDILTQ